MRVFRGFGALPGGIGPSAVAIGNFDGVHLGHRAVLSGLVRSASGQGILPVAVTFHPHPLRILAPERSPLLIQALEDRLEAMERLGLRAVVVVPFNRVFADLQASRFLEEMVLLRLGAREVWVGSDARFGRGREGDLSMLRQWEAEGRFRLVVADDVASGGHRISSSGIRRLVARGEVEEAARHLGRPFEIRGEVVRGASRGRGMGFPTANLVPDLPLVPGEGIYAAEGEAEGLGSWPAAVHVGPVPTFGIRDPVVEAHLLDFDGDLPGRRMRLRFLARIRSIERFDRVDALRDRIAEDVRIAREVHRRWASERLDIQGQTGYKMTPFGPERG